MTFIESKQMVLENQTQTMWSHFFISGVFLYFWWKYEYFNIVENLCFECLIEGYLVK